MGRSFRVGSWQVDPDLDQLSRGTEVVKVRRQVMDLLVYLAERPGQMVGSDDLLDGLWSGKFVTSTSVYNCVGELRRALASDTQQTYIETIPKRGYRLLAPVSGISQDDAGDTAPASGFTRSPSALLATVIGIAMLVVFAYLALDRSDTPDISDQSAATANRSVQSSLVPDGRVSVAVLPFVTLSTDPEQEFLADGITEEVANSLARLPALRVTGRTSAFYFKGRNLPIPEIGETLGVQYVVEGSLRREDERLRVRYQVIRAEDGFQVWSDTLDHPTDSILAMEHDVALSIARALDIVLDAADREAMYAVGTRSADAYRHFLRGRELIYAWLADGENEQIWRANEWFDQAIRTDPQFAAAYSLRSYAYIHFLDGGLSSPVPPSRSGVPFSAERALDRLRSDVSKAIRYADDPGVRIVNQFRQVLYSDDFTALPTLAGQVDPLALANTPDVLDIDRAQAALLLLRMEDTALTVAEHRVQRNPLDAFAYNHAWGAAFVAGDIPRATEYLERGVSIVGTGSFFEHNRLMTEFAMGHMDEVVRLAEDPDWGVAEFRSSVRALVYSVVGRTDEARGIIDQLVASSRQDIFLAVALREIGEAAAAMQMLQNIDASPGGTMHFIYTFKEFGGRLPFDLAWTPIFSARLAEAGVAPETFDLPL